MTCSMPGFPVLHYLPDFAQIHICESMMLSNHLILCHPLPLLPSTFPSIKVFSKGTFPVRDRLQFKNIFFCLTSQHVGISSPTRDWTLVPCVESRGVLTTRFPRKSREIDSSYKSVEANEETKLLLIWSFFWNDENQVACVSAWTTRLLSEVSYKNVELWHVSAMMSYSRKISEQQEFTKSDVTGLQEKKKDLEELTWEESDPYDAESCMIP